MRTKIMPASSSNREVLTPSRKKVEVEVDESMNGIRKGATHQVSADDWSERDAGASQACASRVEIATRSYTDQRKTRRDGKILVASWAPAKGMVVACAPSAPPRSGGMLGRHGNGQVCRGLEKKQL